MRLSKLLLALVLLFGVCLAVPATEAQGAAGSGGGKAAEKAEGGEKGGKGKEAGEGVSYLEIVLSQSGVPGWIIIGLSVIAIYLVLQFSLDMRRKKFVPAHLTEELQEDVKKKRIKQAYQKVQDDDSVLGTVLEAGFQELRGGYDEMVTAMEETGQEEAALHRQRIGWLSLIGSISPMLGLTGTVLGMMGAFGTISQMEGQPPPQMLASNIQFALVTTCEGLVVAVPVMVAYAVFRNRLNSLMLEVNEHATRLTRPFKRVKSSPSPEEEE